MGRKKGQPRHELIWLYEVQGGICAACGRRVAAFGDVVENDQERASQDHVVPRAAHGSNELWNKVMMHVRCNVAKGDRPASGCVLIWQQVIIAALGYGPEDCGTPIPSTTMADALTAALGGSHV